MELIATQPAVIFYCIMTFSDRLRSYMCVRSVRNCHLLLSVIRFGDVYAALRDCYTALSFDPSNHKAHLRQASCFHQLKWHQLARECIHQFQLRFPTRAAKSHELARAIEEDANKSSRSKGEVSNWLNRVLWMKESSVVVVVVDSHNFVINVWWF